MRRLKCDSPLWMFSVTTRSIGRQSGIGPGRSGSASRTGRRRRNGAGRRTPSPAVPTAASRRPRRCPSARTGSARRARCPAPGRRRRRCSRAPPSRRQQRAQFAVGPQLVAHQAVAAARHGDALDVVRAARDPHQRALALGDARQRLRREHPLLQAVRARAAPAARGVGKNMVVAAAGMDRVVDQRLAVRRERHAPGEAVELSGEDVALRLRRPLRKPERVDQLQQHAVPVARPRGMRVHRRAARHRPRRMSASRSQRSAPKRS